MNTMVRRQNSFGRELCDEGGGGGPRLHPSNNPTPTFCTLPRDSKACEVCVEFIHVIFEFFFRLYG